MADDRKIDPAPEDWDSLPLDPDDDWDETPARPAPTPPAADGAPADAPAEADLSDPAEAPAEADDWDEAPDYADGEALDEAYGEAPVPADDETPPRPEEIPPSPREAPPAEDDDFEAAAPGPFEPEEPLPADPETEDPDSQPHPPPQKVELDLDGAFLDDLPAREEPEPEEPDEPGEPEEPEAPEESAPPEEPAPVKALLFSKLDLRGKIPPAKLLLLVAPALLLLAGLGWGLFRFLSPAPVPPVLVIDPAISQREPEPGELPLKPFYINFAGEPETIVEMSVQLYYNDLPDRELIEANLPAIREAIFRLTRNRGSQVVTSGEMQRTLRQELVRATNEALGAEAVSYVQIVQFRILH